MKRFPTHLGTCAFVLLAATALGAAELPDAPAATSAVKDKEQVSRLLLQYRKNRSNPKGQVEPVLALAELGPDALSEIKTSIDKQLQHLAAMVKETQAATALDKKLAELRKTLADLRGDPDLTKDKIEKTGLPALEELKGVYPQWEKQAKKRQTKLANAIAQLRLLADFLRLLEEESAKRNKPGVVGLPVGEYRDKTKELLAAINASDAEADARVLAENVRLSKGLSAEETAGVHAINALRMLCGLRPLLIDPKLCEAARGHCKDMIDEGFFAHESSVPNKKTPFDRAQLAGTTTSAENIFKGSGSASEAVKGWFLSPGHHKNMLGDSHKRQGLGCEGVHWTSLFGD